MNLEVLGRRNGRKMFYKAVYVNLVVRNADLYCQVKRFGKQIALFNIRGFSFKFDNTIASLRRRVSLVEFF